jgi:hypothetical protein
MNRKLLIVAYDVTDFTDKQIGRLELEAVVQGERSKDSWGDEDDGHPDVRGLDSETVEWAEGPAGELEATSCVMGLLRRLREPTGT